MSTIDTIFTIGGLVILAAFIGLTFMQFGAGYLAFGLSCFYVLVVAIYTADAIAWESLPMHKRQN